jgi:hypothetical protein
MEIEGEVKQKNFLVNATHINITENIQPKISDKQRPSFSARHFRHTQKETL